MVSLLRKATHIALDQVFPLQCIACNTYGFALCSNCAQLAEPVPPTICLTCGRPQFEQVASCLPCQQLDLIQDEPTLLFSRSATLFTSPIREAVHGLKYEKRTELASILARYLFASFRCYPWIDLYNLIDAVTPVPLHAQRLADRGYNQAGLIAESFSKYVKIPFAPNLLERSQNTDSQVGKSIAERQQNVANAFRATTRLDDLVILLIDDVCTTGATLHASAQALKDAGALEVYALTLATPQVR